MALEGESFRTATAVVPVFNGAGTLQRCLSSLRLQNATLKEVLVEAQVVSHILLVRAGYIRRVAVGIYSLLPFGVRMVKKIERIIREELDRVGNIAALLRFRSDQNTNELLAAS